LPQPLTGIVTSAAKLERAPEQVKKVLRAYLRSVRRLRQDKADTVDFIGRRFSLDAETAEEVYKTVLATMSTDGTIAPAILETYLDQVKKEAGAKKLVALSDIVDYRLLHEAAASAK
jgi:ABC-type nitrate/sulfonate/bicarbonate transport system substrate-binding protein